MPQPMPTRIKVGLHVYRVLRKSSRQLNGDLGECDTNALVIGIRHILKRSKAQEILLHEVLHACTHPSVIMAEKLEDEEFVNAIAPVLLQVMRENPTLLAYLQT